MGRKKELSTEEYIAVLERQIEDLESENKGLRAEIERLQDQLWS